ncbi:MAG: HEAT repeat domain-containing protein, partial [Planctomycetes bacterium]|nr:HEAT repeat domain-containing protein [Planctomycetota bacterium]
FATPDLLAHGGIYRGPADTVPQPPDGRGGRPTTPGGPGNPTTPRTGQPTTPTPSVPNPSTGGDPRPTRCPPVGPGKTGPRGAPITDDLTQWSFWWEFNKHGFIGLREAVRQGGPVTGDEHFYMGGSRRAEHNVLEPTSRQILEDILPALKKAIDSTEQRDIVSSCMVAMAKIGRDHPDFALMDVFGPRLQRGDQEIRETAALAIGIAAVHGHGALDALVGLALDDAHGRDLYGGELDVRTRSFAIYGLGLFANEHTDPAIKQRALTTMRTVLEDDRLGNRNLKVAAIQGIGMLAIDRQDNGAQKMLDEAVDALRDYYLRQLGPGEQLIQSHCPHAITKLLGRKHPRSDDFRQRFAAELEKPAKARQSHDLARACALALGQLCERYDDRDSVDAGYSKLLMATFENHKDAQTRNFSLLALGQIGGGENRAYLLRVLRKGQKALERPWAALALGVMSHSTYREQQANDRDVTLDAEVGRALLEQLDAAKLPDLVGALGIALGLNRCHDAADKMEELVRTEPHKQEQAGYLCLGLALARESRAIPTIRNALADATRRTQLFVQAAIALGVLGDKSAAEDLQRRLADEDSNLATLAAVAEALGQIGDRRSVEPLKQALFHTSRSELQRAFAAVALGGIADRALLPWHAEVSTNINYRAAVETLTNQQSGVLDIL